MLGRPFLAFLTDMNGTPCHSGTRSGAWISILAEPWLPFECLQRKAKHSDDSGAGGATGCSG